MKAPLGELVAVGLWLFLYSLAFPRARKLAIEDLRKKLPERKPNQCEVLKDVDVEVVE